MSQELGRPVDACHAIASFGQRERQPAGAARHVEDLGAGGRVEKAREAVGFASSVLGRERLHPHRDGDALEKPFPPIRLHVHG
jgi:hypothetical protein